MDLSDPVCGYGTIAAAISLSFCNPWRLVFLYFPGFGDDIGKPVFPIFRNVDSFVDCSKFIPYVLHWGPASVLCDLRSRRLVLLAIDLHARDSMFG